MSQAAPASARPALSARRVPSQSGRLESETWPSTAEFVRVGGRGRRVAHQGVLYFWSPSRRWDLNRRGGANGEPNARAPVACLSLSAAIMAHSGYAVSIYCYSERHHHAHPAAGAPRLPVPPGEETQYEDEGPSC